jgi:outer membrane protein assembly factor BamB
MLMAMALVLLAACGLPTERQTPLPSDTPVVFTYYESDGSGGLAALHANNGLPMWKTRVGYFTTPPAIANGVVYGIEGEPKPSPPGVISVEPRSIVAVQASDGKILWRVPLPDSGGPVHIAADASIVAVATWSGGVYGLDPATGAQHWHVVGTCSQGLVVHRGMVYISMMTSTSLPPNCTFPSTLAHLVAVRGSDGATLWQTLFDYSPAILAANDHAVYGTTIIGTVVGVEAHSGRPLAAFPDNGASLFPAPGAVRGWVVAATEQFVLISPSLGGSRHLWALSAADEHMLWDAPVDFGAAAESPSAVRITDDLVIGGDGTQVITAVRVHDGSIAWRLPRFGDHGVGPGNVTHGVVFAILYAAAYETPPCLSDCVPAIVALDVATGTIYWKRDAPGAQMMVATYQS